MHEGSQPVPDVPLHSPDVELAVEVFAMLADATRVRIVLALGPGELSVSDLAHAVDKHPTAVSQHLAKLRLARMVTTRQEGTRVFYRLTDEHAHRLVREAISQAEHAVDTHPRHHRAGTRP
jgi:DNA-binding transcriptional ArsR family regulator